MGTTAHVVVNGGPGDLLGFARARIEDLEGRWSRFREDSEISRLNHHGYARVGPDTELLVVRSISGWRRTGGRFDPTVYGSMLRLGYACTFDRIGAVGAAAPPVSAPGCAGIEVVAGTVRLPPGAGFDPGGIGKGLAADIVASEMLERGADGAVVNLGGDVRAAGSSDVGGWVVRVEEPLAGIDATFAFAEGAVATSTPLRRVWTQGGEARHHLVDPARGLPLGEDAPVLVSMIAAEGWWAEVCTKAAMILPRPLIGGMLEEAAALVSYRDGSTAMVNGMERYRR